MLLAVSDITMRESLGCGWYEGIRQHFGSCLGLDVRLDSISCESAGRDANRNEECVEFHLNLHSFPSLIDLI